MRFRTLELVRYGGFADRTIEFGDGAVDLHLIVGPNEAGKSTMLSAIGDFLFGIPGQSGQNWRFDYSALRLRAVIEHDGDTLDLVRRKGTRNTLLNPDDSPASDDTLARWLVGLDRSAFERMYGLDHDKLRKGGANILEGREEAAQIVLEAGTGIAGIGETLKGYNRTAAELFVPRGQNPVVNALLRERDDAKADLREKLLGETEWKAVREKAERSRQDRDTLIAELGTLEKRAAMLARVQRVRAPLARLADTDRELEPLSAASDLPADSRPTMISARAALREIDIKSEQLRARIAKANADMALVVVDNALLDSALDIAALEERRPVIEKGASDLNHRKSELAQVERTIATARAAAKLAGEGLPTPGWLKRAGDWRDAMRALNTELRRHLATRARLDTQHTKLPKTSDDEALVDPEPLRVALQSFPTDAPERRIEAEDAVTRADGRLTQALGALFPWSGDTDALAGLALPNEMFVAEFARDLERARAARDKAAAEVEAKVGQTATLQARIDREAAAGTVPTEAAVRDARELRDAVVVEAQQRLNGPRHDDDAVVGVRLGTTIGNADTIVDRHASEATRVAEHALALADLVEATRVREDAEQRNGRWSAELDRLEQAWTKRLAALGFSETIPASGFSAWRVAHGQALAATVEATAARSALLRLNERVAAALADILTEVARFGLALSEDEQEVEILKTARRKLAEIDAVTKARETWRVQYDAYEGAEADYRLDDDALKTTKTKLEADQSSLIAEIDWEGAVAATAIVDALEALTELGSQIAERAGFERQIAGIERDADEFAKAVQNVGQRLGRPATDAPISRARELADALKGAQKAATEHARLKYEVEDAQCDLDELEDTRAASDHILEELRGLAGVEANDALEPAITNAELKRSLTADRVRLLEELTPIGDGLDIEALREEVNGIDVDEAISGLAEIDRRRTEIIDAREEIARTLSEAERAIEAAGTDDAAADAQQRFSDLTSQLATSAEAHVTAATSAALLKWVIDKHRAQSQAPLLARASTTFSSVPNGAFDGLRIDYDDDDRPRLVGTRAGGARVDAAGMSEGTRDQLFLALRLAAIETRTGNAVPLVCDDLLVTANDRRAGSMLRVLAAAALTTQVIVFTHHEHLIEVAKEAIGASGFNLHRIETNASVEELV